MIDKAQQYRMVRQAGGVVIGGIDFKRPDWQTGLLGLNGRHIEEANRAHVALPGGGFLNFWGRDIARPPRSPSGNTYTCLSPFDDHPDATLVGAFTVASHRFNADVGVTPSMPSDARDRSYGWRINSIIEDTVTGEFLESSAPESVESDDGQSGLEEFIGHLSPCGHGDIRSCECCRCPECNAIGIRGRKNKTPTYACGNPSCDANPFEQPALRPARQPEPTGD